MIHVFEENDGYEVWLDTEVSDKDGICVGSHKNRHAAIEMAKSELAMALNSLDDFEKESPDDDL